MHSGWQCTGSSGGVRRGARGPAGDFKKFRMSQAAKDAVGAGGQCDPVVTGTHWQ